MKVSPEVSYHYKRSRKQQAYLFVGMGIFCWVYVVAMIIYEIHAGQSLPTSFRLSALIGFPITSAVLWLVALWHFKNPAVYELTITIEKITVVYPDSEQWSFSVKLQDIKRFESRQSIGPGGKGICKTGILLKSGDFFEICMNYRVNIRKVYHVIRAMYPEITFPSKVNIKASGLGISKEYTE